MIQRKPRAAVQSAGLRLLRAAAVSLAAFGLALLSLAASPAGSLATTDGDSAKGESAEAAPGPTAWEPTATVVYRITVAAPITPATADFLDGAIATAAAARGAALVVVLDTPGGLLESTKTIVQSILQAPLPVLVYVAPGGASATSAGVFLTMAAHVAAMAPGTSIGAAHPVGGQGQDIEGEMGKKVENFATGFGNAIAERRGRNVEWAEKAVRESVTATENEAVASNIVDFVAVDLTELLQKSAGREVEVAGQQRVLDFSAVFDAAGQPRIVDVEMTTRQRLVAFVSNPNIAYLLMMAAMLGLYIEFSNPGLLFPGVAGAICLLLALLASQVLPISSAGALLLFIGMAFLVAEMFFPSFGILGVGGLVALVLGSLFLYTPESALTVDRRLIATMVGMLAAALALVVGLLVRDRARRPHGGGEGLVGDLAVAITELGTTGKVKVRGEIWNATSSGQVAVGDQVRIDRVRGLTLEVSAAATNQKGDKR